MARKIRFTISPMNGDIPIQASQALPALRIAIRRIGPWLSAAMDDPDVCPEMKRDIEAWLDAVLAFENEQPR